jgi:hypothetical protein
LPVVDLGGVEVEEASVEASRLLGEEAARPFDLSRGPLLRPVLVRFGPEDHVLGLTVHHVVFDEWSAGILRRELSALYEAFVGGRPSPLAPLEVQYADYASWQREWLSGEVLATQLGYWRERLGGMAPLELPTDRPRPPVRSAVGASVPLVLGPELSAGVRALARAEGATVFMVLLAAFQALLGRWAGADDVAVGTPVANRSRVLRQHLGAAQRPVRRPHLR